MRLCTISFKFFSCASSSSTAKWSKHFPDPAALCSHLLTSDERAAAKFYKECTEGREVSFMASVFFPYCLTNKKPARSRSDLYLGTSLSGSDTNALGRKCCHGP